MPRLLSQKIFLKARNFDPSLKYHFSNLWRKAKKPLIPGDLNKECIKVLPNPSWIFSIHYHLKRYLQDETHKSKSHDS